MKKTRTKRTISMQGFKDKEEQKILLSGFAYGVILALAVVFVVVVLLSSAYDLKKTPQVQPVNCEIQDKFEGCEVVLSSFGDLVDEVKDCENLIESTNEAHIERVEKLNLKITTKDETIADYDKNKQEEIAKIKLEMQTNADIVFAELVQCNNIRQNLENVCNGYVCKGDTGFVYGSLGGTQTTCPVVDLACPAPKVLSDFEEHEMVNLLFDTYLDARDWDPMVGYSDSCEYEYKDFGDCLQRYY